MKTLKKKDLNTTLKKQWIKLNGSIFHYRAKRLSLINGKFVVHFGAIELISTRVFTKALNAFNEIGMDQ
jgi:hypothetical protein